MSACTLSWTFSLQVQDSTWHKLCTLRWSVAGEEEVGHSVRVEMSPRGLDFRAKRGSKLQMTYATLVAPKSADAVPAVHVLAQKLQVYGQCVCRCRGAHRSRATAFAWRRFMGWPRRKAVPARMLEALRMLQGVWRWMGAASASFVCLRSGTPR